MERKKETTDDNAGKPNTNDQEITSASVKNASATGDGAVQKTDEFIPQEDDKPAKVRNNENY